MYWGPKVVLLLPFYACLGHVRSFVPPPTNVSVSCVNFENIVYWNYSNPLQLPEYTVTIQGYSSKENSVKTTQQQLDITENTEDVSDVYKITVTAWLNGSEKNSSSNTVRFTYSQDLPRDASSNKCVVDFPPLNITALPHTVEISFDHPLYVYDAEALDNVFQYTVFFNETEISTYECMPDLCTEVIHLPEHLYGQCFNLQIKGDINSILFETSEYVCSPADQSFKVDVAILTGLVCGGFVLLMLLIICAVIYKKVTRSDSQRAIFSKLLRIVSADPSVVVPEQPDLSEVKSISHTPLLVSADDHIVSCTSSPTTPSEDVTHLPNELISDLELQEDQEHEDIEEDEDGEISSSGYDCPKFSLEMSPGDMVEAYRS